MKYQVCLLTDDPDAALRHLRTDDRAIASATLYRAGVHPKLPGLMLAVADHVPGAALHFVGFKDDRYWNAVKVFGVPDVVHRIWDERARQEIAPGDVAIFAEGSIDDPCAIDKHTGLPISWDASQQDIIARGMKGIDW